MRFVIIILLNISLGDVAFGQNKATIYETQPEYPGGIQEFHRYVTSGLELSNKQIKKLKGSKLFIQFVVREDGFVEKESVSSVKGMTTIDDSEIIVKAEELVKKSIQWKPGTSSGQPVQMRLVLPINF